MKRFTLMAIAALALIFAVTSCDKTKKGSITFQLKHGEQVLNNEEPQQLPLDVVIMPVNANVKSVSFVFKGTMNNVSKTFKEIDVKEDKDGNKISSHKGNVDILLDSKKPPLSESTDGKEIASYPMGEYTFTVKTDDKQTFTFMFKIAPKSLEWAKTFEGVKIFNINANENGSLNLATGKTVSISAPQAERYLMNNSKNATFNAGFTSDSVQVNSKWYKGNGCMFYKVMSTDGITFDSDPMAVARVAGPKYPKMVKTIDGLQEGDLLLGYIMKGNSPSGKNEAFLIKVKAIDPNEGAGSQGSMTFDWKYLAY